MSQSQILNASGLIDYAGDPGEPKEKCINCGCETDDLDSEGLCSVCHWDYIAPEDMEDDNEPFID